jgi:hypothetical protein
MCQKNLKRDNEVMKTSNKEKQKKIFSDKLNERVYNTFSQYLPYCHSTQYICPKTKYFSIRVIMKISQTLFDFRLQV